MIIPATRFIFLCFEVNQVITVLLLPAEINENISNGKAMPTPNKIKLKKLATKLTVDVDIANKTIKEAGLQGNTIAPKKNPKIKADQ